MAQTRAARTTAGMRDMATVVTHSYQQSYAKRAAVLRRYQRDGGVAGDKQFNGLGAFMVTLCARACERDANDVGKLTPVRAILAAHR